MNTILLVNTYFKLINYQINELLAYIIHLLVYVCINCYYVLHYIHIFSFKCFVKTVLIIYKRQM